MRRPSGTSDAPDSEPSSPRPHRDCEDRDVAAYEGVIATQFQRIAQLESELAAAETQLAGIRANEGKQTRGLDPKREGERQRERQQKLTSLRGEAPDGEGDVVDPALSAAAGLVGMAAGVGGGCGVGEDGEDGSRSGSADARTREWLMDAGPPASVGGSVVGGLGAGPTTPAPPGPVSAHHLHPLGGSIATGGGSQTRYWTEMEHNLFLAAVQLYGAKNYVEISRYVGSRTPKQVRSHSQKYQLRLKREATKRTPAHPAHPHAAHVHLWGMHAAAAVGGYSHAMPRAAHLAAVAAVAPPGPAAASGGLGSGGGSSGGGVKTEADAASGISSASPAEGERSFAPRKRKPWRTSGEGIAA